MTNQIYSTIYSSRARMDFGALQLNKLTTAAQQFNYDTDITGFLYYDGGFFFQYIEGPQEALGYLFSRIEGDRRHSVMCSATEPLQRERLFKGWSMHLIGRQALVDAKVEGSLIELMHCGPSEQGATRWYRDAFKLASKISEHANGY
ncbi:MAG: BLUF domain-containing protein [Pseudomonadales bacterium]